MSVSEQAGMEYSVRGTANELRLLAALLDRRYNASKVDLPHSKYDLLVQLSSGEANLSNPNYVRIQVKTVGPKGQISFKGGIRGGRDRQYKSDVKEYVQSTLTSDVVVGVEHKHGDGGAAPLGDLETNYYFVPTLYIETLGQKSMSVSKLDNVKNRWDVLENCRDEQFVLNIFRSIPLIGKDDAYRSGEDSGQHHPLDVLVPRKASVRRRQGDE